MTTTLFPFLFVPTFSWPANPGGLVYTYIAGTTTPQATYADDLGSVTNANPVVLDANGSATIRLDPTLFYHFVMKDPTGASTIWDQDNYQSFYLSAAAIGTILYPTVSGDVGVVNQQYPLGDLRRYGVDLTGATDSTTQVQNAATSVGAQGGGIVWHPGGNVMINQTIKLSSNTTVDGVGAGSLWTANPSYAGLNTGAYSTQNCQMFGNVNYGASVLTDHDITVRNCAFNWGGVVISGGGAFSISFRFVDRVRISNVNSIAGDNVTAMLACRDQVISYCQGLNCRNCYFDHWDGDLAPIVIGCVGRNASGSHINQGIQVTGVGSFADAGQSGPAVFAFNQLYNVQAVGGTASAMIANANAATSSSARLRTFGNYCESCDNGLVYQGAGSGHVSIGDEFNKCQTGSPIFFNTDASGSPSNTRVINPTLLDCNHLSGNVAMIVIQGTNNRVEGINVASPAGVLYQEIVWFPTGATNCYASIADAPSGLGSGTGRVVNQGTGCLSKDIGDLDAMPPSSSAPTLASASTIAPTLGVTFVSGTVTIETITPPTGCLQGGQITLIPTAIWATGTSGNIALATTAVVDKTLILTYNPFNAKWYPSY